MGRPVLSRRAVLGGLAVAGGAMLLGQGSARAAASPPFAGCDAWGARPPSEPVPIHDQRPVKILVHHTATPNVGDVSEGAAFALARGVQNFHMDRRGWLDTGQHFTISRGGTLMEGRHRSLEMLRGGAEQVEGAHCTGQNVVAIGIENEGTYIDAEPPGPLWDRLRETCAYVCQQYGIAPTELYGHRDFKDTACPGDRLYGMLPRLRSEVGGVLGRRVDATEAGGATWPLLRPGDTGVEVETAQQLLGVPAGGRFDAATADAVRRFQLAHHTEEINGLVGGETWPLLVAAAPDGPAVLRANGMTAPPTPTTDP